jgi:Fe-S cluster assembly protein SufB
MELSTYLESIKPVQDNLKRTLVADEGSYVSYLEGCTAPSRDENQLRGSSRITLDDAEIK